jgi:hypothetical protein
VSSAVLLQAGYSANFDDNDDFFGKLREYSYCGAMIEGNEIISLIASWGFTSASPGSNLWQNTSGSDDRQETS